MMGVKSSSLLWIFVLCAVHALPQWNDKFDDDGSGNGDVVVGPPSPPDTETCKIDGVIYQAWEEIAGYSNDPCNVCRCDPWNNGVKCHQIYCDIPVCAGGAWPVTVAGQCCPGCPPADLTDYCIIDHILYNRGDEVESDDPCEECVCDPESRTKKFCEEKDFNCTTPLCADGARPIKLPGQKSCCPQCPPPGYQKECVFKGRRYREYDPIPDYSSDPCETCICGERGLKITCIRMHCDWPVCRDRAQPIRRPGECCHSCPVTQHETDTSIDTASTNGVCTLAGRRYYHGDEVPSSDPCERCYCDPRSHLQMKCEPRQHCGIPFCGPGVSPIYSREFCCPVCPTPAPPTTPPRLEMCHLHDRDYYPGENIPVSDPCITCECDPTKYNKMVCNAVICQNPCGPYEIPMRPPGGSCCSYECKPRVTTPRPLEDFVSGCVIDGKWIAPWHQVRSSDPCEICGCNPHHPEQKSCHKRRCRQVTCRWGERPVVPPGRCCPVCRR